MPFNFHKEHFFSSLVSHLCTGALLIVFSHVTGKINKRMGKTSIEFFVLSHTYSDHLSKEKQRYVNKHQVIQHQP